MRTSTYSDVSYTPSAEIILRPGLRGIRTGNASMRVIFMLVRCLYNSQGRRLFTDNDNKNGAIQPPAPSRRR